MLPFLINRLPTKLLSWKTPYEFLFNKPPNYELLKVFGCLCFATYTQPHKDKLAFIANSCIFLGHQTGFKAYKVYDLVTRKVVENRDVVFS